MVKIDISDAVWDKIAEKGKFGETENDVLGRILEVEVPENGEYSRVGTRGLLPPEETKCRFNYKRENFEGQIKNGYLEIPGIGKFTSLSAASGGVTNTSRDGWYDWYLLLPGESKWIIADEWRKRKY